jgi:hypothetical protein
MNAEELRLGNYVYSKSCNCNFPKGVIQVDFEAFRKIHLFDGLSGLEPIELTEEWLLKFGFEKVAENDFILGKYSLYYLLYYDGYRVSEITPKYVHKLQNLYFALTGKELVVSDAVS